MGEVPYNPLKATMSAKEEKALSKLDYLSDEAAKGLSDSLSKDLTNALQSEDSEKKIDEK